MKIIAEVGSNWNNEKHLFDSVSMAKDAGADIVKFQHFSSNELYGRELSRIDQYHVSLETLYKLKQKADQCNIEFMCTGFSISGYHGLNNIVKRHKIASSESNYKEMVDSVFELSKPTIVSTGGLSFSEIKRIVCSWDRSISPSLTLLYCDPTYPSYKQPHIIEMGLKALAKYGVDVGFSDHTKRVCLEHYIVEKCSIIEKHYNPFSLDNTPDAGHALGHKQFKKFVENIKNVETPYVENKHRRMPSERGMFRVV